jgi:uncharacterized protein YjdB
MLPNLLFVLFTLLASSCENDYIRSWYEAEASIESPVAGADTCDILQYHFTNTGSVGTPGSGSGSIDNRALISITYPYATSIPGDAEIQITHNGKTVEAESDWAIEDGNSVRLYTVTAKNGRQKFYRVITMKEAPPSTSDTCDILLYYFTAPACVGIPDPGNPLEIKITYPSGTSIPANEDAITVMHNGKSVTWGGWNTAGVREYTVTAENGLTKTYRVTAVMDAGPPVPPGEACDMLLYYFAKPDGELLSNGKLVLDGGGDDDSFFIDIIYPAGTVIPTDTNIVFLATGAVTKDNNWVPQGSGHVRNYTVTAESGKQKHYLVRAMMADAPVPPSDDRDILLYYFTNPVSIGIFGSGSGNSTANPVEIAITYPEETGIPDDAGIAVIYNGSEVTATGGWTTGGTRDYTVTAESGLQKHYRITATAVPAGTPPPVPPSETCDILLYYFTDPVSIGTFGSGSGNSAGDPVKITIPYPDGTTVPGDDTGKIKIIHNGASADPTSDWVGGVRNYAVTAADGTKKYYEVTAQQEDDIIHVTGITLNYTSLALAPVQNAYLNATVYPEDAADLAVTWTSSNNSVATYANGTVTAHAAGNAVIIVTTKDGGYAAMCAVTVEDPVTGITLNYTTLTLAPGQTAYLNATVTPPGANQAVTWSINPPGTNIASLQNGMVTGLVEGGPVTVTAKSVADTSKTATGTVTVAPPSAPPPGGPGEILIYNFTNPSYSAGTIGSGSGSASDPIQISIHYSFWAGLPANDDGIQILYSSTPAPSTSSTEWATMGESSVRYYTVTGDTTKYYKVTATPYLDIYTEQDWSNAITYINGTTGTVSNIKVFSLNIIGHPDSNSISVGGITTGSTVTGPYKEIRLTGTGTIAGAGSGSLIRTAANQTFVINGPTLIGAGGAPLVYIVANSTVKLQSGSITGNINSSSGGGVYVYSTGASFTMSGGTVSGNAATSGGGVYVYNGGGFTMSGGTISGNGAGTYGGGVCVYGGNFMMNGGTISGNGAGTAGGGVCVDGGSTKGNFTMNKGIVYGSGTDAGDNKNTASSNGAAVYVYPSYGTSNVATTNNTVTKP